MYFAITLLILLLVITLLLRKSKRRKTSQSQNNPSRSQNDPSRSIYEKIISENDFDEMVINNSSRTPVLVDFFADWCAPCKAFSPILSEAVDEYGGEFLLAKINVDANKMLVNKYNIKSMPTVMLFKEGECVERFSGGKLPHSLRFILAKHGIKIEEND